MDVGIVRQGVSPMFPGTYVPRVLCSPGPMFPGPIRHFDRVYFENLVFEVAVSDRGIDRNGQP